MPSLVDLHHTLVIADDYCRNEFSEVHVHVGWHLHIVTKPEHQVTTSYNNYLNFLNL